LKAISQTDCQALANTILLLMTRRLEDAFDAMLGERNGNMGSGSVGTKLQDIVKIERHVWSTATGPDTQGFGNALGGRTRCKANRHGEAMMRWQRWWLLVVNHTKLVHVAGGNVTDDGFTRLHVFDSNVEW
jgi:hypothetical protein